MNACEMAIEILRKTDDGKDLCLRHFWLVENAVNGLLNDRGNDEFCKLHEQVVAEEYKKPYFHEIKHLTIDYKSSIFWKDEQIELYDFAYAFSKEGKKAALELAERCKHLEKIGAVVNHASVVWHWSKYKDKKKGRY